MQPRWSWRLGASNCLGGHATSFCPGSHGSSCGGRPRGGRRRLDRSHSTRNLSGGSPPLPAPGGSSR
jgi:hypothetical protein